MRAKLFKCYVNICRLFYYCSYEDEVCSKKIQRYNLQIRMFEREQELLIKNKSLNLDHNEAKYKHDLNQLKLQICKIKIDILSEKENHIKLRLKKFKNNIENDINEIIEEEEEEKRKDFESQLFFPNACSSRISESVMSEPVIGSKMIKKSDVDDDNGDDTFEDANDNEDEFYDASDVNTEKNSICESNFSISVSKLDIKEDRVMSKEEIDLKNEMCALSREKSGLRNKLVNY